MSYDWHFSRVVPYWQALKMGAVVTIELTIISVILGGILGIFLGVAMARPKRPWILGLFIDVIRSIPLLPLLLFFYYFLTKQVIGISVDSFWVSVVALALSMAAFTADIIRAAIISVPKEAIDAARALGFSEGQIAKHISAEYAIRNATPGMAVLVIATLKNSSLAAVVNVGEVTYVAQSILAETARSLEVWVVVGMIYVALVLPTTYLSKRLEAWARRGERPIIN
jgi:His/Glu/Gln/Arg/opine family amino acid ABC transporter permease subunit